MIDKWDVILASFIIVASILTILAPRIKANIVYNRPLLDMTTEVDGELFVWENASPQLQLNLGVFEFMRTLVWAVLIGAVVALVAKLLNKAGWFK